MVLRRPWVATRLLAVAKPAGSVPHTLEFNGAASTDRGAGVAKLYDFCSSWYGPLSTSDECAIQQLGQQVTAAYADGLRAALTVPEVLSARGRLAFGKAAGVNGSVHER